MVDGRLGAERSAAMNRSGSLIALSAMVLLGTTLVTNA
jgi:hypothetical protein